MAFAFPTASTVGQLYSYGGTTWEWDGTVWNVQPSFGDIRVSVAATNEIDTKTGDLIIDSATGETQIDDNLTVAGTSTLTGDVSMAANASVATDLTVTGLSTLTGDVTMVGAATVGTTLGVTGDTTMTANASVGGTLDVTGVSTLTGNVTAQADVGVTGNIAVGGISTLTGDVNMGANATITGNLNVLGTTTTVNSTTVTIDDPVMTLGGAVALGADDSLDKGVEFQWHDGAAAKVGFFGFDRSASQFTFIADATNTAETFSGVAGNVKFGAAEIGGHMVPSTSASWDLGSAGALWNDLYLAGAITTGPIQIGVTTVNTIDTSAGNLIIDSAGGTVQVADNVQIDGTTNLVGDVQMDANATVGGTLGVTGASSFTTATFDGNIIPFADNTYDSGSATNMWANVHVANSIMLNSIPLTVTGNDLFVDGVKIGGMAVVDVTAPATPDEGQFWLDRNTGNLYIWVIDAGTGIGNWIQPL